MPCALAVSFLLSCHLWLSLSLFNVLIPCALLALVELEKTGTLVGWPKILE